MQLYHRGEGLAEVLQRVLPQFERELRDSWSLPQFAYVRDGLVPALLTAAQSLAHPPAPSDPRIRWDAELLKNFDPEDDVWILPYFELELAKQLQETARVRSSRMVHLVALAKQQPPSEAALKYLHRVCACYAAGLDAETVIMCRAVIDTAVRDRVDRARLRSSPDATMRQRLAALRDARLLSMQAHNDAWTVWLRGNKAVHEDPDMTRDVLGTLTLTMAVLEECTSA